MVTLCVASNVFLWLKNKTWSGAKASIYYTGEQRCSLELTPSTLIPGLSCSPLPLRKFNPLPCHCYNNLWLLDTSLNMTVTQNRCHTHLGQAVLWQYIFIACYCADFQSLFPFVAAQGCSSWGRGAGHGTHLCCSFSRPEFLLISPSQQKSPLVLVATASSCALTSAACRTWGPLQICALWKFPVLPLFQPSQVSESLLLSVSSSWQFCFFLFIALDSYKEASISTVHFFNKMALMHFSVSFLMHGVSLRNYPQGLSFFLSLPSF